MGITEDREAGRASSSLLTLSMPVLLLQSASVFLHLYFLSSSNIFKPDLPSLNSSKLLAKQLVSVSRS